MRRRSPLRVVSYRRAGRVIPRRRVGLRVGAVILRRGERMAWHSTEAREELLIVFAGRVRLEVEGRGRRLRRRVVAAGSCAWLPSHTRHRVVNRARAPARYLYVTAPTTR